MVKLPILLVDDNRDACDLLARYLALFGYEADVAYDGVTALGVVQEKKYGLTISDYQMPDMNGIEMFRRMHQFCADLPGFLLTAFANADVRDSAEEVGMRHVLSKPASFQELVPLIEQTILTAS